MSQTWDTPDWQRSPLVPFVNLHLFKHSNVGPPAVVTQTVNVPGGLGGLIVYDQATTNAVVTITSQPSNTVLRTTPQDNVAHAILIPLSSFVPGDTQLVFSVSCGFPSDGYIRAYAVVDTALVTADPNFPLTTTPAPPTGVSVLSAAVDTAFPMSTYTQVIAGVAGKTIKVLSISGAPDAALNGSVLSWYDGSGGGAVRIGGSPIPAVVASQVDFGSALGGRALTAGNGLYGNPGAGGAVNWRGTVSYTQA